MKISIKNFFSKCDSNLIFCAVLGEDKCIPWKRDLPVGAWGYKETVYGNMS